MQTGPTFVHFPISKVRSWPTLLDTLRTLPVTLWQEEKTLSVSSLWQAGLLFSLSRFIYLLNLCTFCSQKSLWGEQTGLEDPDGLGQCCHTAGGAPGWAREEGELSLVSPPRFLCLLPVAATFMTLAGSSA